MVFPPVDSTESIRIAERIKAHLGGVAYRSLDGLHYWEEHETAAERLNHPHPDEYVDTVRSYLFGESIRYDMLYEDVDVHPTEYEGVEPAKVGLIEALKPGYMSGREPGRLYKLVETVCAIFFIPFVYFVFMRTRRSG